MRRRLIAVPLAVDNNTPTATPTPTPIPTSVFNRTVVVGKASGVVLVRSKGGSKFEPLDVTDEIELGSTIDARKGKFRTKGQYSAATVRGTKWLVEDGCRSTLTRVTQGVVTVRDAVLRKNITVRKGKRYTARPRR